MNMPRKTKIMAILNMTPDSFSDGGRLRTLDAALRTAEHALVAGADILDVGGESTRPGAMPVEPDEEMQRVLPVIAAIRKEFPQAMLSIDTRKAAVANAALEAGAGMVNDVSGLQYDDAMIETVARQQARLIIMHSQGTPDTMQRNPQYPRGIIEEITHFLGTQADLAIQAGVKREHILLDPGFGFGKTLSHNLTLLSRLDEISALGFPLLVGASRKSFLTLGNRDIPVHEREALTAVALSLAIQKGAAYVRVHDVETQFPIIRLAEALLETGKQAMPSVAGIAG